MSSRNNPFFVNPYSQHAQYSGSSCKSSVSVKVLLQQYPVEKNPPWLN